VSESLRDRLRALPSFVEALPPFEPSAAPADPLALFTEWLEDAIATGVEAPHVFTLATSDTAGAVSARVLRLKNLEAGELHFAGSRTSRKGRDLNENPRAAMTFHWHARGRQVRFTGPVRELSAAASADDWIERPSRSGPVDAAWQLWALRPVEALFFQAAPDGRDQNLSYPLSSPLSHPIIQPVE